MSSAIPPPPLWAFVALSGVNFTFNFIDFWHDPSVFFCRLNKSKTSLLGLLDPNAEGYMDIRNTSKYLPLDVTSSPTTLES
jgi:hypothetical protein